MVRSYMIYHKIKQKLYPLCKMIDHVPQNWRKCKGTRPLENLQFHFGKSVQIWSFCWSVFSCIRTEYDDLMIKSPYSVRIHENTDQRKLRILTVFTQCVLVLCVTKNVLNNVLFLIYRFEKFIPQHLCFVCLANLNTDTLKIDYGNCKRRCSLKVLFKYSCRSNACRFFKNGLRHRCFPCEYCKIFKNSIYTEHLCR